MPMRSGFMARRPCARRRGRERRRLLPSSRSLLSQKAELDVAIPDQVAVVLQADVALADLAVVGRVLVELAGPEPLLPVGGVQLVLDDLLAVEPVLDLVLVGEDVGPVLVDDGVGGVMRGRVY